MSQKEDLYLNILHKRYVVLKSWNGDVLCLSDTNYINIDCDGVNNDFTTSFMTGKDRKLEENELNNWKRAW